MCGHVQNALVPWRRISYHWAKTAAVNFTTNIKIYAEIHLYCHKFNYVLVHIYGACGFTRSSGKRLCCGCSWSPVRFRYHVIYKTCFEQYSKNVDYFLFPVSAASESFSRRFELGSKTLFRAQDTERFYAFTKDILQKSRDKILDWQG